METIGLLWTDWYSLEKSTLGDRYRWKAWGLSQPMIRSARGNHGTANLVRTLHVEWDSFWCMFCFSLWTHHNQMPSITLFLGHHLLWWWEKSVICDFKRAFSLDWFGSVLLRAWIYARLMRKTIILCVIPVSSRKKEQAKSLQSWRVCENIHTAWPDGCP